MHSFLVAPIEGGARLDRFLADKLPQLTRSHIQKIIAEGGAASAGIQLKSNHKVKPGESIVLTLPEARPMSLAPEALPLDIIYEDECVLALNKGRGMVVHPAAGHERGTLVSALLAHCGAQLSGINGVLRPGIVHRLDKDTTGILLVAKNNAAHVSLAEQLKNRSITKEYLALVHGSFKEDTGRINAPIARNPRDRKLMGVVAGGREAVTEFEVIRRLGLYTLVKCLLITGRTHQIRVHMKYASHPIVGDAAYGVKKERFHLEGQLLHAHTIEFEHPLTKKLMRLTAPPPPDFVKILAMISEKQG